MSNERKKGRIESEASKTKFEQKNANQKRITSSQQGSLVLAKRMEPVSFLCLRPEKNKRTRERLSQRANKKT